MESAHGDVAGVSRLETDRKSHAATAPPPTGAIAHASSEETRHGFHQRLHSAVAAVSFYAARCRPHLKKRVPLTERRQIKEGRNGASAHDASLIYALLCIHRSSHGTLGGVTCLLLDYCDCYYLLGLFSLLSLHYSLLVCSSSLLLCTILFRLSRCSLN